MSGIIGSKLNIRGSGLVGSLGTDGQHLLSSGPGKTNVFEAAAGAGLVKLVSTTLTGATAAIAFDSTYITSTYSKYLVTFEGITVETDGHDLAILLSTDDGSSFATTVGMARYYTVNSSTSGSAGSVAYYPASSETTDNASHEGGISGHAFIYNTTSTVQDKIMLGQALSSSATPATIYGVLCHAKIKTSSAINYLKLYEPEAGGNFTVGTATLYGIVN